MKLSTLKKKAFTLIELIIVIACISILSVVAVPKYQNIKKEVQLSGANKNKELLDSIVNAKYKRYISKGLNYSDSVAKVYSEISTEIDFTTMQNPLDKTKKGVGIIYGDRYDGTNKAAYIFTRVPDITSMPEGTIYTVVMQSGIESNYVGNTGIATINLVNDSIQLGSDSTYFLRQNGYLYSGGYNSYGQLAKGYMGTQVPSPSPSFDPLGKVNIKGKIKKISVGYFHIAYLLEDGSVYTVGANMYGQLGTGTTINASTPIKVNLTDVVNIETGAMTTFFIKKDGTVYGCGLNAKYQLGLDDTVDRLSPTKLTINDVNKVFAGYDTTFILKTDGTLYATGNGENGQQLNSMPITNKFFIKVNISNVVQVSPARDTTIVLKSDGTVVGAGKNMYSELGNNSTSRCISIITLGITDVKQIEGRDNNFFFVKNDNTLYGVGNNISYQLGLGNSNTPIKTITKINLSSVESISGRWGKAIALTTSGDMYAIAGGKNTGIGAINVDIVTIPTKLNINFN
ncbi:prepilin-type N-terminal cleavage/methylation domain-containing protein [Clostridium tertium]|uniref:prepilin-type N-terminal cleavage/methylation domain-containing protein n=1 Tax=Clostridium tertium TaxID=1559 RepID=UPI0023B3371B|nr:prepilin-type N-terminal cleavage/methylation domain-containing protein [Clostridium tertium]